jgi:predicted dehydrogenase
MWRVAIVGCGNIAGGYDESSDDTSCETHAQACRLLPQLELVAVCDLDRTRAEQFSRRWNAKSSHHDLREMLERSRPDILAVCSPTGTHADMLVASLESPGLRAVLCEKPAGFDPQRLRSLLPEFDAARALLAVNYSRAYAPGIQSHRGRLAEMGGCIAATVKSGKGVFNYGSHAVQWLGDWLGGISDIEATGLAAHGEDPVLDATLVAGETPVRLMSSATDCFEVEFRCLNGSLRFSDFAYEGHDGDTTFRTGLEMVMRDVYSNLTACLDGHSSRLVEGREALAALEACATLAAQSKNLP